MKNLGNFYSGGNEYYMYENFNNCEIRKIEYEDDYDVIYVGTYENCIKQKNKIYKDNYEYDLNL